MMQVSFEHKHLAISNMAAGLGITAQELAEISRTLDSPITCTVDEAIARALPTVSTSSRAEYRRGLMKLSARCGDWDLTAVDLLALETWTQDVIEEALMDPRARHGRGAGENFTMATRFLFASMVDNGIIHTNPAQRLRAPSRPQSPRRGLTPAELNQLFDVAEMSGRDPDLDALILWYLVETGCRREGVLELSHANINSELPSVRITEKYRRSREIPISHDLCSALLDHRDHRNAAGQFVFHYHDGQPVQRSRFDTLFGRIQSRLAWARSLGVSAHWIRHTTLTRIADVAGIRIAQAYAGHVDSASGAIGAYTRVTFEKLQRAHALAFLE